MINFFGFVKGVEVGKHRSDEVVGPNKSLHLF